VKRSQFGEDAHIRAVLDEIGDGSKVLCDIGARLTYSNTAHLLEDYGWHGVLIDRSEQACADLKHLPNSTVICEAVTVESVNKLVPAVTSFLSIDVDGPDWYLFAALGHRVEFVVIETNPLDGFFVAAPPFDKANYGASVEAMVWLGERKGYDYIGRTAVNAFFVRKDLQCTYRLPPIDRHSGIIPKLPRNACAS